MPVYYDDNFGTWDGMEDDDMRDFYQRVQDTNIIKECLGCERTVSIQPQYGYCNTCADKREKGMDF